MILFIVEMIFQMSYYGIFVAQRIFMAILATFAPIMFALSIVPPWSSAWSQWISKYLSLSLWGFVTYMCLYYIDFILMYNLGEDPMPMAGTVSGASGYSDGGVATMAGVMGGAASGMAKEAKHMFTESSASKAASKMGSSMRDSYNRGK